MHLSLNLTRINFANKNNGIKANAPVQDTINTNIKADIAPISSSGFSTKAIIIVNRNDTNVNLLAGILSLSKKLGTDKIAQQGKRNNQVKKTVPVINAAASILSNTP